MIHPAIIRVSAWRRGHFCSPPPCGRLERRSLTRRELYALRRARHFDGLGPNWRNMMKASEFVDFYEILEISPNANSGTIERMFRYLAQRYHPDNPDTGDRLRFDLVMEAHETLRNPEKRAQYDTQHRDHSSIRWKLVEEASDGKGIDRDVDIQTRLLSILFAKRRQNVRDPGIGDFELERLLGCPAEHLEFHLWYQREKGWIARTETGTIAITVEGVDRASSDYRKNTKKLLTDQSDTD